MAPNNAFKPKPLRSANHMAGRACHVLRSTTRFGLTWVLGLVSRTVVVGFQAICSASLIRSVCTSHARCRYRQSALQHLGFGQARLFARFDLPSRLQAVRGESSWPRAGCVSAAPDTALVVLFASGLGCRTSGAGARERRPNESFKPMPHRGANPMAGTACHALHAPLRHGL